MTEQYPTTSKDPNATSTAFKIIDCSESEHSTAILDILNHAILNSTALFDYQARSPESMKTWFATKNQHHFPVIGAVDTQDKLLGFATYGTFRAFPAFKYTVEHSIYIHHEHRACGLGRGLLQELTNQAIKQDVHVMVGGIEARNQASIQLHQSQGFVCSGIIEQAGFKFGRWLDLAFYQKTLSSPSQPCDG